MMNNLISSRVMNETYNYLTEIDDLWKGELQELAAAKRRFHIIDDVQTLGSDLPTNCFADGSAYNLFPDLENIDRSDSVRNILNNDIAEAGTMPPDEIAKEGCNDLFDLGTHPGHEGVAADFTVSPSEIDSAVSSPEMDQEVVDLLLAGITENISSSDSADVLFQYLNTTNDLRELYTTEERYLLKEVFTESNADVINITTDHEITTENGEVHIEVVDESHGLSSMGECLKHWSSVEDNSLCDTVVSSVVDLRMSTLTNERPSLEDHTVLFSNTPSGNGSVNIPLSSNCSINKEIIYDTKTFGTINDKKRRHSNQGSDISSLGDDDSTYQSPTSSPIEDILKRDHIERTALRRRKNNEASKVTRAKRKCVHKDLMEKEQTLLKRNAELRIKVDEMQKESDILRELLTAALNSVNSNT